MAKRRMTDDYDPAEDGRLSYEAAIEAKRLRGDTHDWEDRLPAPRRHDLQVAAQIKILQAAGLCIHIPKRGWPYFTRKIKRG